MSHEYQCPEGHEGDVADLIVEDRPQHIDPIFKCPVCLTEEVQIIYVA